jgi:hypothetical protein
MAIIVASANFLFSPFSGCFSVRPGFKPHGVVTGYIARSRLDVAVGTEIYTVEFDKSFLFGMTMFVKR